MEIKERNILVCILLSVVTCGIYGIYWIVMMTKEAVSVKDPADGAILEILLMLFIPFVGLYMVEKKFSEGRAAKGGELKDNSVMYLILGLIFPIAALCMIQNDLNKLAA